MVRKVSAFVCSLVLICGLTTSAQASTHTVYDNGTISSTYITYFKDILSGINFTDNYVAFRSAQNEYTLIVGDLIFENGNFTIEEEGKLTSYRFYADSSNYSSNYRYEVKDIYIFDLSVGDNIIYSDLGQYPQLIERGAKYEQIQTLLIIITMLCIVINRIFYNRKR